MKILFVVNNYYAPCNGLSASARRTVQYLREAGQEVRILSGPNLEQDSPQPDYLLKVVKIPVFDGLIKSHGYCFAGRGPEADKMKRAAAKLYSDGVVKYAPEFHFCDRDQLRKLAAEADIYVHCANVEVEGLSALEALQQGPVPVIAQGELTATAQFALDSRSLFPAGDARALAERLDYWIEHPEERIAMGPKYAESMDAYDIHKSIESLIDMFHKACSA